ncbi:MAG: helix-turn-helix transcriptional regulator [Chloroflexi bacterium]|nr:helix-turn-helix transcriptional regulator [Chloroflexota bacterium]
MATVELPVREQEKVCCTPQKLMRADRVEQLTDVLKALADPTRLQMVAILREAKESVCICDLTATFDLSQPTISHHMARLRAAGLVESDRDGRWCYYRLRTDLAAPVKRLVEAVV